VPATCVKVAVNPVKVTSPLAARRLLTTCGWIYGCLFYFVAI
jgi:hypothetical protein